MSVVRLVCGCACVLGMEAYSSRIQIYVFLSNEWNRKREMFNNWRGSHGSWPDQYQCSSFECKQSSRRQRRAITMQMRIRISWKSTGVPSSTLTCGCLSGLSQRVSSWPGSKSSCLMFCDNSGKKSFLFRLSRSSSSMMICGRDNQGQEGYYFPFSVKGHKALICCFNTHGLMKNVRTFK